MSAQRAALFKQVDDVMHETLLVLLNQLQRSPKAREHFNEPVQLNEYDKVIFQPMDLGTVHRNLLADLRRPYGEKVYQFAEEFAHDVRLVFKNCFLFNPFDHHVFKSGITLLKRFEEEYAKKLLEHEKKARWRVPLRTRCQLLLTDMRRHPLSEWFRRSQDWARYGDEYFKRLKSRQGMDLDEVQARLTAGRYDAQHDADDAAASVGGGFNSDAFAADVRIIWQNGLDFNGEKSNFGIMLKFLKDLFETRLKHIVHELPRAGPPAADAANAETRKRRRELHAVCVKLQREAKEGGTQQKEAAATMADAIEEACPEAVVRKGVGTPKEKVQANLDKVDHATLGLLLEELKPKFNLGRA